MGDYNIPGFVEAKNEYTKQLVNTLQGHFYIGVKSIYEDSVNVSKESGKEEEVLVLFQNLLSKIPNWNQEIITAETERIINCSKCDFLDDLITAVFISHTKILTSIGPNKNEHKVNLRIPKTDNFIHKCYINIAREIWKNPYLFNDKVRAYEFQKNIRDTEKIINESINYTVQNLLPIKDILKEHLDFSEQPEIKDTEDIGALLLNELLKNKTKLQEDKEELDKEDNEELDKEDNDSLLTLSPIKTINDAEYEHEDISHIVNNTEIHSSPLIDNVIPSLDTEIKIDNVIPSLDTEIKIDNVIPSIDTDIKIDTDMKIDNVSSLQVSGNEIDNLSIIPNLNLKKIETFNSNNKQPITINKLESEVIPIPVSEITPPNKFTDPIVVSDKIQVSHIDLDDTIKPPIESDKSAENTEINKLSLELNKSAAPAPSDTIILENDIDDTETLDGFINDSTKLLEKKGISVEKEESVDNKKVFSFFDDLED